MPDGDGEREEMKYVDLATGIIKAAEAIEVSVKDLDLNFHPPRLKSGVFKEPEVEKPKRKDLYKRNKQGMGNFLRHKK